MCIPLRNAKSSTQKYRTLVLLLLLLFFGVWVQLMMSKHKTCMRLTMWLSFVEDSYAYFLYLLLWNSNHIKSINNNQKNHIFFSSRNLTFILQILNYIWTMIVSFLCNNYLCLNKLLLNNLTRLFLYLKIQYKFVQAKYRHICAVVIKLFHRFGLWHCIKTLIFLIFYS